LYFILPSLLKKTGVAQLQEHLFIVRGRQACSVEESLAENRKHQRAAKSVCSVKYKYGEKNLSLT